MTASLPPGENSDEVSMTRVFDAPRAVVFKFWTEPELLAQWFAPEGFYTPREDVTIEPKTGGRYQLRMAQENGDAGVWMLGTILELIEPELLVVRLDVPQPLGLPPMDSRLRVEFYEQGNQTLVKLQQGPFSTVEQRDQTVTGWGQSFDKLARHLVAA